MRTALLFAILLAPALLSAQPGGGPPPQDGQRGGPPPHDGQRGGFRGQPGGGFAWWDSPIAGDLNLSDQQLQQIRMHTREFRNRLLDASTALKKAEADLEDIMNDETVDQKRASDAIEKVAVARAEMTRSFSLLSLRLRGVLTYQQWHELQKRSPQRPGGPPPGRDGMGPGGRDGKQRKRGDGPPPPRQDD